MVRMDDDGGLQLLKQEDGSLLTPNILHLKNRASPSKRSIWIQGMNYHQNATYHYINM